MKRILMLSCCLVLSLGVWGCSGISGGDPLTDEGVNNVSIGGSAVGDLQGEDAAEDAAEQADAALEAEEEATDATVEDDADEEELPPVEIKTEVVHGGTQGVFYAMQKIEAKGGSGKYLWEVAGKLPAGLEVKCYAKKCQEELLAKKIKITGTPTEAGSFDIVVTATDAKDDSLSAEAAYTLEIASKPVEQSGDLLDRIGKLRNGIDLLRHVDPGMFAPAPTATIEGPKVINVENAFPVSMVNGLLKEPLEFQIDVNGGQLPYKDWKVQYLDAEDYELTPGPGGTVANLKVVALYPRLTDPDKDPRVGFSVSVTDANGKTATAKAEILVKYPLQNINAFTVNACMMKGMFGGSEICSDNPDDLSLTFYRGDKAMVAYNQYGIYSGMKVADGGIAIPMTQVDRITADDHYMSLVFGSSPTDYTKITLKTAYWWAEFVPAGGETSFLSETDILELMTGWEKTHPQRIWHRVGDNIGKTTNGGDSGCDLTQEEIDQGYMCL